MMKAKAGEKASAKVNPTPFIAQTAKSPIIPFETLPVFNHFLITHYL